MDARLLFEPGREQRHDRLQVGCRGHMDRDRCFVCAGNAMAPASSSAKHAFCRDRRGNLA